MVGGQRQLVAALIARRRRLAKLIDAIPEVGERLAAGPVGVAQADELAGVFANPRCADQLEVTELDGALYVSATGGTAEDAAEVVAIFQQALQHEFDTDVGERTRLHGADAPASLLPRTDAQRRFDALQAIFRRAVAVPAGTRPPAPLVNLVCDQRSFEETLARHGLAPAPVDLAEMDFSERRCDTVDGTIIHPDAVLQAALVGHVRRVVVNSAGIPVEMGRKRRLFTGAARDAAKLLARRCEFPGCDVPAAFAQVDHLDEYHHHGTTDPANASITCGVHNRAKHHNYRAQRDHRGRLTYYRRDGTPITPIGRRLPDEPQPNETPP